MCGGGRLSAGMAIRAEQHASDTPVVRTCVGCKERAAKSSLLRLVAVEDVIRPDPRARLPGRGAYLHPSLACLGLARRRRAVSRAPRTPGTLSPASPARPVAGRGDIFAPRPGVPGPRAAAAGVLPGAAHTGISQPRLPR